MNGPVDVELEKYACRMNIFLLNPRIQEEIEEGDAGDYVEEDSAETGLFFMVSKTFEETSQFMILSNFSLTLFSTCDKKNNNPRPKLTLQNYTTGLKYGKNHKTTKDEDNLTNKEDLKSEKDKKK